jgi:hypothetical protein
MEERLIAPCGMNCALCVNYQAQKYDLNLKGFTKKYCPGCRPRGKNCAFFKQHCDLLAKGLVHYCSECAVFPCERLKAMDLRYRNRYHMGLIENLKEIQTQGIDEFLAKEEEKWKCPACGETICCHNGLCLNCDLEKLIQNKKYHWNGK